MARGMFGGSSFKKKRRERSGRPKLQVRRGDRVRVMRGNYAGSEGTVLRALPKENRIVVEGVNMRKRHRRPSQQDPEGGIMTFEAPIHASNVMLVDPKTDEPTRVRQRLEADGTKERISVRSEQPIPKQRT